MNAQTQENLKQAELELCTIFTFSKKYGTPRLNSAGAEQFLFNHGKTLFELFKLVREQEEEINKLHDENSQQSDEIRHLKSELCIDDELDDAGIECSYCNERVDKVHGSPFMDDAGDVMCRDCWNMTREEYIGSEGTDIGPFDDEDAQEALE